MKFTVDGRTTIGWSCLVEAESVEEAEEKAREYWRHNTTFEDVEIIGTYEGDLN